MSDADPLDQEMDSDVLAAIVAMARRAPIDSRLPPPYWAELTRFRLNFDGEAHAIALRNGWLLVLACPKEKPAGEPIDDWRRMDLPLWLVMGGNPGHERAS